MAESLPLFTPTKMLKIFQINASVSDISLDQQTLLVFHLNIHRFSTCQVRWQRALLKGNNNPISIY